MAGYESKIKCLVGIDIIDAQHGYLIDRFEYLLEKLKEEVDRDFIKARLVELEQYAAVHFELEEGLMAKVSEDAAFKNKIAHAEFWKRFINLREAQENEQVDGSYEQLTSMVILLHSWIENHVCGIDCKLRELKDKNKRPTD